MQFSDNNDQAQRERELLVGLTANEQGKRLIEFMGRELHRMDVQNRVMGQENKTSAALWLAGFLEAVDSENTTKRDETDAA